MPCSASCPRGRRSLADRGDLPALFAALRAVVGKDHVLTDADMKSGYEIDWLRQYIDDTPCVVRPRTAEQVAGVLRACADAGVAVVPQGGNTGLVGGSTPRDGAVVLSMRRFDELGEVDLRAMQVTAGAGVTIEQLQRHAGGGARLRRRLGGAGHCHRRRGGEHERGRVAGGALRHDARPGDGPAGGAGRRFDHHPARRVAEGDRRAVVGEPVGGQRGHAGRGDRRPPAPGALVPRDRGRVGGVRFADARGGPAAAPAAARVARRGGGAAARGVAGGVQAPGREATDRPGVGRARSCSSTAPRTPTRATSWPSSSPPSRA